MLDVQRRPDVDAGRQQLFHILPALGMTRTRGVGVGVFVDQQQLGPAGERAVDVEFHHLAAAVFGRPSRQDVQSFGERLGVLAAVGLDDADDHIGAFGLPVFAGGEHLVGFADPRRHAEIDPQPSASLPVGFG